MLLLSSAGRVAAKAGDRLLGLFVPHTEASAAYRCSPSYQAGACYGRGWTQAECECRSGRTYQRWYVSCHDGSYYTNWTRTNLAC